MPFTTWASADLVTAAKLNNDNTIAVATDTARTITVSHTWNASQAFNVGISGTTATATPSALSATQYSLFPSTVSGAALMGYGTTNDVALMNRAGTVVLGVGPNTTTVNMVGLLDLSGASAGQVKFPATQNASADANTLDDYEEGTWTPNDQSGAALTFTVASGSYEKIGRLVVARGVVTYPVTASGANTLIGGLPFTVGNTGAENGQGSLSYSDEATQLWVLVNPNATTFAPLAANGAAITNVTYSSNTMRFTLIYHI